MENGIQNKFILMHGVFIAHTVMRNILLDLSTYITHTVTQVSM